ncbi:HpcH/HpaI aldolase/citrate lyase family protein [Limobrevibacterium gyesilva]|uniref:CoA ester lyase n=1 Tax=Limobrevibacterium gyesilva TaxID=2991712 RepID=A0AA41YLZ6_9PROT|nr:CoA ester lyase [Limobrevibacterium gyesilva]MCW3475170.1 CoA ester lyase [Limobrevibacterium gyesilva]
MSRPEMRLRSPLFAPGDSERKAQKALASVADAVILDLEDSVAPPSKDAARAATAALLPAVTRPGVIVRVNPRGTPWYLADLAAVVPGRPQAVMLPKCSGADDLLALDHHLEVLEVASGQAVGSIGVLPIVTETAASVLGLAGMAGAARRVLAFCFGAEDLSADLGIAPRRPDFAYPAPVAHARAAVLIAAGAAGLPALDTPWPDPRDAAGLAREAAAAAADGFAGKLCIHPDQIAPVNTAFTPDPHRVAWARTVRDAFAANPDAGVFALDGKMIDRPHLKLAQRILAASGE